MAGGVRREDFMRVHQNHRERGFAIYMTTLLLLMIIPMMGLAIDTTLLYVVKTRLQGAVDGAALAGAKALAVGTTDAEETTAATTAAETYVKLNYPSTFFFSADVVVAPSTSSNPGVVINTSVAHQRTVAITASVAEPTIFMQWFNFIPTTVVATASTIRKDVNIVFVMDRSGSLSLTGSCAPLMADAQAFVGQFSSGHDNVGLVTYAGTTYVNFAANTTFATASPNVSTMLGALATQCNGSTSTAYALWTGYQQLIALNEPTALNVLLLFTDGNPTGVYVNMPIVNSSPCTKYTAGNAPGVGGYTLPSGTKGYLPGLYNIFTVSPFAYFGLINPVDPNAASGGEEVITNSDEYENPNSNNCTYDGGGAPVTSQNEIVSDFYGLPIVDINGNSLVDGGYQSVTYVSGSGNKFISLGSGNGNASPDGEGPFLNVSDSAAANIRTGATDAVSGKSLSGILIFTIGLENTASAGLPPVNSDFLERIANDPRGSSYNSAYPAGTFYNAPTVADLQPAFAAVASQILRLAK
jgi:Flp pilus assembly protein TadG